MPAILSRRALFGRRSTTVAEPHSPQAPQVANVAGSCLAARGIACGTCSDPCEPRALRLRPALGGRALPIIDLETCTGCGECARLCPVGAIQIIAKEDAQCA